MKRITLITLVTGSWWLTPATVHADDDRPEMPIEIEADQLEQDAERTIRASGAIRLQWRGSVLTGEQLHFNPGQSQGKLEPANIDLAGPGGHASAASVTVVDPTTLQLDQASFTNCDCEDPPWHLKAQQMRVDYKTNQITADHASLELLGVPVAYTPWWRHPIARIRQSGFLIPSFRSSRSNGLELDIPYYWNIAPDRDATLTLHPTTQRGLLGKVQYRYLDQDYRGELNLHAIQDTQDQELRGLLRFDHRQRLDEWRLNAHLERTRTRNFITDFDQELVERSALHLESYVTLNRLWSQADRYTGLEGGSRWFQDLRRQDENHTAQQLPYLTLLDSRPLTADGRLRLENGLRFDHFFQLSGDHTQRFDVAPTLRYQHPLHIGSIEGAAGVRGTFYRVSGLPEFVTDTIENDSVRHREASWASLRLNSTLRRHYPEAALSHTLEPTVQYVINNVTDQSQLPNYDSWNYLNPAQPRPREFNITNLYAINQFPGIDRISGGQWISYGLTSRLFGQQEGSGSLRELATFAIGQRWAPSGDRDYQGGYALSDLVAGMDLFPHENWAILSAIRYDPHASMVRATDIEMQTTLPQQGKLAIGYHRHQLPYDEAIEDASIKSNVRLLSSWRWLQQLDYSLEQRELKSWRSGLQYEHECWSFLLNAGRHVSTDPLQNRGNFIGFLVSFQGLGGYGIK
ncbi:MAG: LPS-assembly protein LptD [Magnetococcales bacterium]|nr:LPS-assembly protein LptD [Magnetococcales bacterium]